MSATFSILSPLAPNEMLDLERTSVRAVEQFLDEHPECEDDWGEMGAGGAVPGEDEVRAGYAKRGLEPADDMLERLARCRSVFSIDQPGDIESQGGLQVSILRLLLERAGESLVLLDDYPFQKGEVLLAKLRKLPGADGFDAAPRAKKKRPATPRDTKSGELRAARVLRILERAINDVRVAIDVKVALRSVSEVAQNYGALLLEEGTVTDAKAAKALGLSLEELTTAAEELERALTRR
jgi:hypothetical protein